MFIRDFNQQGQNKITKINKLLSEEFGMSIKSSYPKKEKLQTILEMSDKAIIKLKDTTKNFQLEPEYAKYLGIKDVMKTMISEGMYAESPAYMEMKEKLCAEVQNLMDSGCTESEAVSQCMNTFRKNPNYCHDDEHILPIVMMAAKEYMEGGCGTHESLEEIATEGPDSELNEKLLSELAKEIGIELSGHDSMSAIEEKLNMFAEVTGKSRDSVVGFLNGLEEDAVAKGIKFFGAKVRESNAFVDARREAIKNDEDEFTVGGKTYKVTGDTSDEKKNESMFDSIIDEMLSEEVESVEEAEVVMAVRALADDIQDHVERLGRMVNEDLPAIADSMVSEFGLEQAQGFKENAEGVLSGALESAKQAKEGMDGLVGNMTGTGSMATSDLESDEPMGLEEPGVDPLAEPDMDVNEPAAAGPEDEPLGRAPVEV